MVVVWLSETAMETAQMSAQIRGSAARPDGHGPRAVPVGQARARYTRGAFTDSDNILYTLYFVGHIFLICIFRICTITDPSGAIRRRLSYSTTVERSKNICGKNKVKSIHIQYIQYGTYSSDVAATTSTTTRRYSTLALIKLTYTLFWFCAVLYSVHRVRLWRLPGVLYPAFSY
jgi:hypothetical protein